MIKYLALGWLTLVRKKGGCESNAEQAETERGMGELFGLQTLDLKYKSVLSLTCSP